MALQKVLNTKEYVEHIRQQRREGVNRYKARVKARQLTESNCVQNSEKVYVENDNYIIYLKNASKYSQISILSNRLIDVSAVAAWLKTFTFTRNKKSVKLNSSKPTIVIENVPLPDVDDLCAILDIQLRRNHG